jgi:hypothetical protein
MPEGFSTDSYPKAPLPTSMLDVAGKVGGLVQQKINIDQSKLNLMNNQFELMNKELSTMVDDPNITKDQAAIRLDRISKTLNLPPVAVDHMKQELNAAPDVKSFSENALRRGMDTQQKINQQYGVPETQSDSAVTYQGVRNQRTGGFSPTTKMPVQPPPTQATVNNNRLLPSGQPNPNYLQPGIVGAAAPSGVYSASPVPAATTVAPEYRRSLSAPASPIVPKRMPVERISGPTGPTTQTGYNFNERFAGEPKIVTGAAPGVSEAIKDVGDISGKDYAADLIRSKNFKADLYPAQAALEGIKELGPKNVGPGTEALNNVKSAIITWLPNVDQKTIDNVATFEQTRKYLTQIARSNGSTGTNDQLAAAFEANPSIKMSSAATENVLKSVIALRKMNQAQTILFGQQNLPPSEYSKWISQNQNTLDPRAFGFDMMDSKAKQKLVESLKKDPKAYQRFETSLQFAHDADLIEKPARK